jgi:hypothetical protein
MRWSSFDKTGGNADLWFIPAGETVVLGEAAAQVASNISG